MPDAGTDDALNALETVATFDPDPPQADTVVVAPEAGPVVNLSVSPTSAAALGLCDELRVTEPSVPGTVSRPPTHPGTVTTFDLWIECSLDGTNFTECALDDRVEATTTGAGPFTDNTIKLVAETAVTTSAVYSARITSLSLVIRARWNIAGTTPSETFEVVAYPK